MSVFGPPGTPPSPYLLITGKLYDDWKARVSEDVALEVDVWLSGLYFAPWLSPSVPTRDPMTYEHPPDDVRRCDLPVAGRRDPVLMFYDVWEEIREVHLLYID